MDIQKIPSNLQINVDDFMPGQTWNEAGILDFFQRQMPALVEHWNTEAPKIAQAAVDTQTIKSEAETIKSEAETIRSNAEAIKNEAIAVKEQIEGISSNSEAFRNVLAGYALKAGSETQSFKVAAATQDNEAVNRAQLNEIDAKIKKLRAAVSDGVMRRIGYITLPSELKVQWGNVGIASGRRSTRVFFPIRFPTFCFVVVPAGGDSEYGDYLASDLTPESFIYHTDCSSVQTYRWLALGY